MCLNMAKNNQHEHEEVLCPYCSIEGPLKHKKSAWKDESFIIIFSSALILGLGLYLDIFTSQIFVAELLFLAVEAISGYESIKKGLISLLKSKFQY